MTTKNHNVTDSDVNQSEASCGCGDSACAIPDTSVHYRTEKVNGLDIFYREAGDKAAPTVLLLHGFPTSSHMYRNLIPQLAEKYHVIAPDFPGFGNSSAPSVDEYDYSFDNMSDVVEKLIGQLGVKNFSLYLMDYGAPVGFRIAERNPERVDSLIIQNGNAYDEGLKDFWIPIKAYWHSGETKDRDALRGLLTIDATKWQYTHGVRDESTISADNWLVDQGLLDRAGNNDIQLNLFYDYRTNVPLYPAWQKYFRDYQPATLIVWGKHDEIFPADGAEPYKRDLNDLEYHLLDTGHFALEEDGQKIGGLIKGFLDRKVLNKY